MKKLLLALMMAGMLVSVDVAAVVTKQKCPAGTYSATGSNKCVACTGNTYSAEGAAKCKACPNGQTANEQHTACVNDCPAHAICPKGPNDFFCLNGFYRKAPNSKVCTICPANASQCVGYTVICKPGYYLNATRTSCVQCPAGHECRSPIGQPQKCMRGWYAPAGSAFCRDCPAGTYAPEEGAKKCTPCPQNAICRGHAFKWSCADGYYKKTDKATTCTKCPVGYMCREGYRDKIQCPAGSFSAAGASKCTPCSGDTYSSVGAAKCKSCPKGQKANKGHTACEEDTSNLCKANQVYDAKKKACLTCPSGKKPNAAKTACVKA